MSKLQQLKLFVNERLTAAAEEIFGAVERTILEFQSEVYVSKEEVKHSELLTLAEAPDPQEVFTAASQEVSVSEAEASVQPMYAEDGQVKVKPHMPRPEFLDSNKHWASRGKGRLQDLLQGEAAARFKCEESTESSSSCYQSQPVASTDGDLLFPHISTEWRDACGGSDFCQPISSDSWAVNDPGEADWMESRGSDSCSKIAKPKPRAKQGENSPSLITQKRTNPFCCKLCGEFFLCRSSLMTHVKSHAKNPPVLCPSNHAASAEGALQPLEAHREDNLCHVCGNTFTTRTHLKRHMLIHTGQKPHGCKECGRRFARNECLRVHMRIHTVERPYTCEVCQKGFRQRGNLLTHMRKHTGEKPHRCGICSRPFAYKKDMMRHMQVHTKT